MFFSLGFPVPVGSPKCRLVWGLTGLSWWLAPVENATFCFIFEWLETLTWRKITNSRATNTLRANVGGEQWTCLSSVLNQVRLHGLFHSMSGGEKNHQLKRGQMGKSSSWTPVPITVSFGPVAP